MDTPLKLRGVLFLTVCMIAAGCEKDDGKPAENYINILGTKYNVNHVLLQHGGKSDPAYKDTSPDPNHYQYTLYVSDGTVTNIAGNPTVQRKGRL